MQQMPKIITIGEVTKDIYLSRMKGLDLYYEGQTPYNKFKVGDSIEASELSISTGGSAFNVATALSKWGFEIAVVSMTGCDSTAAQIQLDFDKFNIDTKNIQQSDRNCTSTTVHLYDLGLRNQHSVISYKSNWSNLDRRRLEIKNSGASWLYVSSVNGQFDLLDEVFAQAKNAGINILFNPGPAELKNVKKCYGLFEDVDILLVNREEAELFTKDKILDSSVHKLSAFVDLAIITDSENGVIVSNGSTVWRAGAYRVTNSVDRTGAGDAFGSGFLANYLINQDVSSAIRFASANAASVVTFIGSTSGLIEFGAEVDDIQVRERSSL